MKLRATAIRVLDDVLNLGEDGNEDVEEVLEAGIAQAPELAVVRVDLPARERVLVCDVDEAAAGDVANSDLDGSPRNALVVTVVVIALVVHDVVATWVSWRKTIRMSSGKNLLLENEVEGFPF